LIADAIRLFRRQKRRPFVNQFLPHVRRQPRTL
jgi:hypothetical protein